MDVKKEEEYITLKQKFDVYYNDTLKPILQKNDAVRHKYVLMFLILLAMSVVLYPLIIRHILAGTLAMQDMSGAGAVLGLSGFLIMILCGPMYMYKCKAKAMVMPDFANFFGNFEYVNMFTNRLLTIRYCKNRSCLNLLCIISVMIILAVFMTMCT